MTGVKKIGREKAIGRMQNISINRTMNEKGWNLLSISFSRLTFYLKVGRYLS